MSDACECPDCGWPIPGSILRSYMLLARDVEYPCGSCAGTGVQTYPNTSTWREDGLAGQALTTDVCDVCWGTGDIERRGVNLRELDKRDKQLQKVVDAAENVFAQREAGICADARQVGWEQLEEALEAAKKQEDKP